MIIVKTVRFFKISEYLNIFDVSKYIYWPRYFMNCIRN